MTAPRVHRGAGLRGLRPAPGDEVIVDGSMVPGLRRVHLFRATIVRDLPDGTLELAGWLIGREDLGELGVSAPFTLRVWRPTELVVRRA